MRKTFDAELLELNAGLMDMSAAAEDAIDVVTASFSDGDRQRALSAIEATRSMDRMERDIEDHCLRLLLRQQPVARDLRTISSALKMISDMERIGDQASDIAEITRSIGPIPLHGQLHVEEMARSAVKMVTDSVESFVKRNLDMALGVMEYDDVVDGLFDQVKEELTALIRADASSAGTALDLLMIAKYLERIGDHAVNVAEWVLYSITGSRQPSGG